MNSNRVSLPEPSASAVWNAAAAIAAIGGSTNGMLHLLALAREAKVDFTLSDIQLIMRETPVLCSFAPRGPGTMVDLHRIGGASVLLKHLLEAGVLDGGGMTVTGSTLAENLADAPAPPADLQPTSRSFRPRGRNSSDLTSPTSDLRSE